MFALVVVVSPFGHMGASDWQVEMLSIILRGGKGGFGPPDFN